MIKYWNMIVWSEQLKIDYINASVEFCETTTQKAKESVTKTDDKELISLKQKYLEFFDKTLEIFQAFFIYNRLQYLEDKWIVITVLKSKVLKDGMLFYDLYNYLNSVKDDKDIGIDTEYLEDKYINLFREIRAFFENELKRKSDGWG